MAGPRSKSSRTARSVERSSSRRAEPGGVRRNPPRNLPAPRAHPCRFHQQDQDGEMEGPGRNPRPGRNRESSRRSSTGAKRAAQGMQSRRGTGPNLRAGPELGIRESHRRLDSVEPPADLRMLGVDPPQSLDQCGRSCVAHHSDWRHCCRFRDVRSRKRSCRDQDIERADLRPAVLSKRGMTSWPLNGRGCCHARRWCARPNAFSTRVRSTRDTAPSADRRSMHKSLARRIETRAGRSDGGIPSPRTLPRPGRPAGGRPPGGARQAALDSASRARHGARPVTASRHPVCRAQGQRRRARAR